ncbi:MAG: protein kinase domain-containing protein [Blastocatellia bacterium]
MNAKSRANQSPPANQTRDEWLKMDEWLDAALDLEPDKRAAFVEEVAGGDRELRMRLTSLLAAADQAEGFLEASPACAISTLFPQREALEIGRLLGHYEIVSAIGAGGMGEVYLARDARLGRCVALKLLPTDFTMAPDRLRRFEMEARAASSLNHPNILTIHDIGQSEGLHFIASEFIDGPTLRQRMAAGPLPLPEALDIATQVARALNAAHGRGILHRDIKPENVMIRPDGLVKVLDFGLAKLIGEAPLPPPAEPPPAPGGHSLSGLMGTPPYMSPEQARGEELDARTDLFSLGAVLYEMIAGRPPFAAETGAGILAAICEKEPPPLSGRETSFALEPVVLRCLAKAPANRYGSAREVADALERLARDVTKGEPSGETGPSIAILPFINLGPDAENEYFCDGLAEELLTSLAKIERLHVAARTSAFSFKGKNTDAREIGQRLKVATVLEGSVRRAGNRLRITAQLVDTADGYHLWSDRFDRQVEDIFAIQDEIVLALVDVLEVKLLGEERARLLKRYTDNTEAYRHYLKGRAYCHRATRESYEKAIEFFDQAIELESDYAPAWAGIAYAYVGLAYYGYPREHLTGKCALALARAAELDPDQHDVLLALGSFKCYYQWDFAGAERDFRRAIQLAPNLAGVQFAYAAFLIAMSRFDEAIARAGRAEELDPLSIHSVLVLGWAFWYARRYEHTLAQAYKLIEMEPDFFGGHWLHGMACLRLDARAEAIANLERAVDLGGGLQTLAGLGVCHAEAGNRAEAEKVIAQLSERRSRETVQAYFLAMVHASLKQGDEALEWLEKAVEERNDVLLNIRGGTVFDFLSADPRFVRLIERVGFPA